MKLDIALVYLRSLMAIIVSGLVIAYLRMTDPIIVGAWIAGLTSWVLFEKTA